jgi:hypothetical protein
MRVRSITKLNTPFSVEIGRLSFGIPGHHGDGAPPIAPFLLLNQWIQATTTFTELIGFPHGVATTAALNIAKQVRCAWFGMVNIT